VMLRLIDECGLRLSERLLGTTADKRKLLKSKKSMEVFEVESCVQGHHILQARLDIIHWRRIDMYSRD